MLVEYFIIKQIIAFKILLNNVRVNYNKNNIVKHYFFMYKYVIYINLYNIKCKFEFKS